MSIISLLIIGGGFLIFRNPSKTQKPVEKQTAGGPIIAQETAKDSDNDGLKDWEEALRGTDPNNPDTDGDGTPDGQEVKEGRNPLVASKDGKTDKLLDFKPEKTESASSSEATPTLTEALSQEFMAEYLDARAQGNGKVSDSDKSNILQSFTGTLDTFGNGQENYIASDIKLSANDDQNAIKDYGNNLALIIKKYFDPLPETEMTVLKDALLTESESDFKKLKPIASAYRNTAKEMVFLNTPKSFSDFHLELINRFNNIAKEIDAMQKTLSDPAQSLVAVKNYQKDSIMAYLILKNLNGYFTTKQVVFAVNEPATLFKIYLEKPTQN